MVEYIALSAEFNQLLEYLMHAVEQSRFSYVCCCDWRKINQSGHESTHTSHNTHILDS